VPQNFSPQISPISRSNRTSSSLMESGKCKMRRDRSRPRRFGLRERALQPIC
jgi:hypothetical protein